MDSELTRYEALMACREKAGSDSQLGRDLGIPQSTMWRIINSAKQLPAEYVLKAERLYGVSRHLLRPDIYPHELPPVSASEVAEPTPLCGPILTARMLAQHGNTHAVLPRKGAA